MLLRLSALFLVATPLAATFAQARPQVPAEPAVTLRPRAETAVQPFMDLTLAGDLGAAFYDNSSAGPTGPLAGATALYRVGSVGFGLSALRDLGLYSSRVSSQYAVLGGYSCRFESGYRVDVLGSLAEHRYSGWGSPVAPHEPNPYAGASATMPSIGVRVRLGYTFAPERRGHFVFGGELGYDDDLKRVAAVNLDPYGSAKMESVGGQRLMVGIFLGVAFDVGRRDRIHDGNASHTPPFDP